MVSEIKVSGCAALLRVSLGILACSLDAALHQLHCAMGLGGDGVIVRDHHDGEFLILVEAIEQFHDARASFRIEITGGLIRQQDFRATNKSPSDGTSLHLTT